MDDAALLLTCWCRSGRLSVVRDRLPAMEREVDRRVITELSRRWSLLLCSVRLWRLLLVCGVQPYGQTPAPVTPVLVLEPAPTDRCTHKLLKCFSLKRENSSNSRSCGWCGWGGSVAAQLAWRPGDGAGAPVRHAARRWGWASGLRACPPVVPTDPQGCPHDVHALESAEIAIDHGVAHPAWRGHPQVGWMPAVRSPSAEDGELPGRGSGPRPVRRCSGIGGSCMGAQRRTTAGGRGRRTTRRKANRVSGGSGPGCGPTAPGRGRTSAAARRSRSGSSWPHA